VDARTIQRGVMSLTVVASDIDERWTEVPRGVREAAREA
jgi:hypothetical protein